MKYLLLILLTGLSLSLFAQNNVGIGTATPNPQAILDIESPDKGILIPRITTVARTAFGSALALADNGMLVYDKNLSVFYYWDGTQWVLVGNEIGSDDQTITNFRNKEFEQWIYTVYNLISSDDLNLDSLRRNYLTFEEIKNIHNEIENF